MSSARVLARAFAILALALAAGGAARVARAQAPDTSAAAVDTTHAAPLDRYLRSLADSTDTYFGPVAAPTDTAGLDSARAYGLDHPYANTLRPSRHFAALPVFRFNRVDGPVWGLSASLGQRTGRLGKLGGEGAYAVGPNRWFGEGRYVKWLDRGESTWALDVGGGRRTATLDRERSDTRLAVLRAVVNGSDRKQYDQQDGVWGRIWREGATHRLGLQYRDVLETPRAVTATWSLTGKRAVIPFNVPAVRGRASEFEFEALWRVPATPLIVQALHANASRKLGGSLGYRRTLLSAGANIGLGRSLSLLPQAEYGTLRGNALPQEAFYLGGSHTLRSLNSEALGGSNIAVARIDLVTVRDVLALAHIPHPAWLPLQAGVFGGIGAVWGFDPYGGPPRPGNDWPHRNAWLSEAGASLLYQPGIPSPSDLYHLDVAFPLGPRRHGPHVDVGISRPLDLLRPFER